MGRFAFCLTVGLVIYATTAFPVAVTTGWEGSLWQVVCLTWGALCGAAGLLIGRGSAG